MSKKTTQMQGNYIKWLESLSDKQFAEFFYKAVQNRKTFDVQEENGHYILSHIRKNEEEMWERDDIALHSPQEYPEGWNDNVPICQFGTCQECETSISSWAKHAICPICNNKVYCT